MADELRDKEQLLNIYLLLMNFEEPNNCFDDNNNINRKFNNHPIYNSYIFIANL